MDPIRSSLFVPGHQERWLAEAHTHGADVILVDLEDAVPPGEKARARELTAEYATHLAEQGQRVHVRINGHPGDRTDQTHRDIEALATTPVESLLVPKLRGPAEVRQIDTILTHVEEREGRQRGDTQIGALIETAAGVKNAYEICAASDRVGLMEIGPAKGGDSSRSLGYEWSGPGRQGLETLYMRQKGVVDGRAAGVQILGGVYPDVEDIEGLREDLQFSKEMGYTGYTVIHPSHVEPVNEAFTPDEAEVEYWQGVLETLTEAEREGKSAVRYEGEMIDIAHIKTARRKLKKAKTFEDDLSVEIDLDPDTDTDD